MVNYWLLKTEPSEYSISMLREESIGKWDGIRNYQARNFIRGMEEGDLAFLYHSSCKSVGIFGLMQLVGEPHPDIKALDRSSKYFDSKASADTNPWLAMNVKFEKEYTNPLLLPAIKLLDLGACPLTAKGNRLSVIPLTPEQFALLIDELEKLNG